MSRLAQEVAAMFAELAGYDGHDEQLAAAMVASRQRAVERTRQWRIDNPRKYRALKRRARAAYDARHPAKKAARAKRWRDRNPGKARAAWRRASAKYRAKRG